MPDLKTPISESPRKQELLIKNPLFSKLNATQLDEISNHISTITLEEGEVLFNQGDEYHSFYLVISGLVKLYRHSATGQEKIIELVGRGRTFAEALMFNEESSYPVTAKAMQKIVLFKVNATHFRNLLLKSPETCMLVMASLSIRLHARIKEIDHLSLLTGRNRVSMFLLDQALTKDKEFRLEIPKNAIACMLSLKPETFSRLLKELCTQKAIEVHDNLIIVLDMQLLRKFAGIID